MKDSPFFAKGAYEIEINFSDCQLGDVARSLVIDFLLKKGKLIDMVLD